MTNSKWALRLAKLVLMGWLIANTGIVGKIKNSPIDWNPSSESWEKVREKEGMEGVMRRECKVNLFVLHKIDSVRMLIENGHQYSLRDYFVDLREVWDLADSVAPWNRSTMTTCGLTALMDNGDGATLEECERLQEEILGTKPKASRPIDWVEVATWFFRQYLLGLLPALLLFLILARQGRIRFSLRRSPASSLLYLALWPINLGYRIVVALQDIDREARLRLQKDSLFSRLSGLEEGFLDSLRQRRDHNELLGRRSYSFGYVLAMVAVIVMRVAPVIDQVVSETEQKSTIEVAHHAPPDHQVSEDDDTRDPMLIFTLEQLIAEAKRRKVWWPRNMFDMLDGFDRGVLHVPLVHTA